ncbi:MAG TPA: hypothetical protein PLZ57_13565 [Pseudobdellovibrionaceae bacterium]|nr:hypothetical protein [Pseudobdellovibrionaceae bacterium]
MRQGFLFLALLGAVIMAQAPVQAQADSPAASIRLKIDNNTLVDSDTFASISRRGGPSPDLESEDGKLFWGFYYSFIMEVVPKANLRANSSSIACYAGSAQAVPAILEGLISYTEINGEEVPSLRNFRIQADDSISFEARNTRAETDEERGRFRVIELPRCQDLVS